MVINTWNLPDTLQGFGSVSNNRTTPETPPKQKIKKLKKKTKILKTSLTNCPAWSGGDISL
jgi:hypothetical protein